MPSKPPTVVQADGFNLASEQKRVWAERLRPRTQVNYTEPEGSDSDRVKNPRPTAKRRLNNDEEAYADDDLSDDEWDYDDLPQYKGTFMPAAFDDISEGAVPPLPGNTPPPSPMIPTGDLLSPPSMWTVSLHFQIVYFLYQSLMHLLQTRPIETRKPIRPLVTPRLRQSHRPLQTPPRHALWVFLQMRPCRGKKSQSAEGTAVANVFRSVHLHLTRSSPAPV